RLRIRGSDGVIFSILFDGASQTFALVDEDKDHIGPAFPAGSEARLHNSYAVLHLTDSSVEGSGPTGPTVTLNLSLEFKPHAKGESFVVEVAATDNQGNEDTFTAAGSVIVDR